MRIAIYVATPDDMPDVYRFWYRIYVDGMGRHLTDPLTNHQDKTLLDPLAQVGALFVARDEQQNIVATLLNTQVGENSLGKYEHLYGFDRMTAAERATSSITTKLMVDDHYRNSRLPLVITRTAYEHTLRSGMLRDYIDCNDHLVPFFKRLGFLPHLGRIFHRDYGAVNSMVINLTDVAYLKKVRSPFLRTLLEFNAQPQSKVKETIHVAA